MVCKSFKSVFFLVRRRIELNIVKEKELKTIEKKQKDDEIFLDKQRVQLEEKLE